MNQSGLKKWTFKGLMCSFMCYSFFSIFPLWQLHSCGVLVLLLLTLNVSNVSFLDFDQVVLCFVKPHWLHSIAQYYSMQNCSVFFQHKFKKGNIFLLVVYNNGVEFVKGDRRILTYLAGGIQNGGIVFLGWGKIMEDTMTTHNRYNQSEVELARYIDVYNENI